MSVQGAGNSYRNVGQWVANVQECQRISTNVSKCFEFWALKMRVASPLCQSEVFCYYSENAELLMTYKK